MSQPATSETRDLTFRASIACDLSEVATVRVALKRFLKEQAVGEPDLSACELTLAEACNNAIQNAPPESRKRPVEIVAVCAPSTIELCVIDHTAGFEWPRKAELPDFASEHGRGVFFIQSLMDHADYSRGCDHNTLLMRRTRISGERPPVLNPVRTEQSSIIIPFPKSGSSAEASNDSKKQREMELALTEMARELCFRSETLAAMCRCSAQLGRSNDLKEFAERLLNDLLHIAAAEWFILRILSERKTELLPFVSSIEPSTLKPISLAESGSAPALEARCGVTNQDIEIGTSDVTAEDPLEFAESVGLVHPIRVDQQLIGTLAIGRSSGEPPFSVAQQEVIRTFADFLAIQLINARLREEQLSARLLAHELDIARGIQRSLLPKQLPQLPGFSIAADCESAGQVGGDFYDLLQLSNTSALFVIADVMGKGVPAALFAALLRSLIRSNQHRDVRPAEVLAQINRFLFDDLSAVDMFITAQIVLLDSAQDRLIVANAGHNPLLVASGNSKSVQAIAPEGMPLGVERKVAFEEQIVSLPPESRFLLYTDGLTESRNSAGECFGPEKLESYFGGFAPRSADALKQNLLHILHEFEAGSALRDDRTFIIVSENSSPGLTL